MIIQWTKMAPIGASFAQDAMMSSELVGLVGQEDV